MHKGNRYLRGFVFGDGVPGIHADHALDHIPFEGADVPPLEEPEPLARNPGGGIGGCCEGTLLEEGQFRAPQQVEVNVWFPPFDVPGQVGDHVLLPGESQFRDGDGDVLGVLDKAVQTLLPVLQVEHIDDAVFGREVPA